MLERATDAARAAVDAIGGLFAAANRQAVAWIESGDVTLVIVLVVIALVLLVTVVVPSRRRY